MGNWPLRTFLGVLFSIIPQFRTWGGYTFVLTITISFHGSGIVSTFHGCREGMVAPWRNTIEKSKQKHNAPGVYLSISHTNDRSKNEIKFVGCRGHGGTLRNILAKSKQNAVRLSLSHTTNGTKNKKELFLWCRGGMVARWKNTLEKSKQNTPAISISLPL